MPKSKVRPEVMKTQMELALELCAVLDSTVEFDDEAEYSELMLLDHLASLGLRLIPSEEETDDEILDGLVKMMESDYFILSKRFVKEQKSLGLSEDLLSHIEMALDFTDMRIVASTGETGQIAAETYFNALSNEITKEGKK